MYGTLRPALGGRRVALEERSGHGWREVSAARTGRKGGFTLSVPRRANDHHLLVWFAGDRVSRSVSGYGGVVASVHLHPSVASWYDDCGATACGFHAGLWRRQPDVAVRHEGDDQLRRPDGHRHGR